MMPDNFAISWYLGGKLWSISKFPDDEAIEDEKASLTLVAF